SWLFIKRFYFSNTTYIYIYTHYHSSNLPFQRRDINY
ncbi:unnamed protein product, partial [Musa textilis]